VSKNKKTKTKLTPEQQEFISFLKSKRLYSAYLRSFKPDGFLFEATCLKEVFEGHPKVSDWIDEIDWRESDIDFSIWSKVSDEWRRIQHEKAKP
jgi:hypothetical protein